MIKALIDGDIVVFRAAFAAEKKRYTLRYHEGGKEMEMPFPNAAAVKAFVTENKLTDYSRESTRDIEPVEHVYANLDSILSVIDAAIGPAEQVIYLTGPGNFRRKLTPNYKANRDPSMRPHWEKAAQQYLLGPREGRRTTLVCGIEADDAIGMEMGDDAICVSLDKDLDTIPGTHYNWVKGLLYEVNTLDAATNFWCQMLTGDPADNVPGVPGVGPVTARRLLAVDLPEKQEATVRMLYKRHGLDFDLHLFLLRIFQSPYDIDTVDIFMRSRGIIK